MIRKFVLPLIAVVGVIFAVYTVVASSKTVPPSLPVAEPAHAEYDAYVAGAGIVEAATENIGIGPTVPGMVTGVYVKAGDDVKAGQALLKIDDRDLQAELVTRQAALKSAQVKLAKFKSLPRPEEIPSAEAKVKAGEANVADMENQYKLAMAIDDPRAMSKEDLDKRRYALDLAKAQLAESQSDLALLKAGSWQPDIEIAQADVASAEAAIKATQTEIERRITRSPIDGQVLQVKIRTGEYAMAGIIPGMQQDPLMVLGTVNPLHVRVDVDENDAWRISKEARAKAFVRGNRDIQTELKFVRVEPYVVPKKSLTGESTERVDTRVLQVLYAFDRGSLPIYVGQQMDVFIEVPKK